MRERAEKWTALTLAGSYHTSACRRLSTLESKKPLRSDIWAHIRGRIFGGRSTQHSSRTWLPHGRLRGLGASGWYSLRFGMKRAGRLIRREPARTW